MATVDNFVEKKLKSTTIRLQEVGIGAEIKMRNVRVVLFALSFQRESFPDIVQIYFVGLYSIIYVSLVQKAQTSEQHFD